ncbi:MAG: phytanoyl-CoA dioxygenase family protein, partial [Caulobacterales bacterium]|nr:phytanoyl-CoA dioxygenase family protein [Caulobacterales bacterium]
YLLRSYIARRSNKELPMHIDSFMPYLGDHVFIMQYSIILQDQSAENGCTVVVPGSHLSGTYTTQEARADAVPIESEAGDVVIWDSRLWHGTTENTSVDTRWAIVATFCRWWMKQHFAITQTMPQDIYAELTDEQKAVLGFCTIPQWDETTGIDIKRGYDSLAENVQTYREIPPSQA